ncbi:MAG: Na+/H+ antiporter NhaA [Gammaproteobacteria bacterium]|nr:Na+/H+ antiporter NhaA [Gammaproteobacteria bacterium]
MAFRFIRQFIKLESSSGIFLFCAALAALIIDNTSFAHFYDSFFHQPISISIAQFKLEKPILHWINDGFMTLFFLLVGLEIKREILEGELNSPAKAMLPLIAAVGGMLIPIAIYLSLNYHDPIAIRGWAIPTATDTAFSLGILTLLGNRIPVSLKIFLTALAIFDDIGAIIVMAIFYSSRISWLLMCCALGLIFILILLNYYRVARLLPYLFVGVILWGCVLKSGVHATLAGIVLAFIIPMRTEKYSEKSPLQTLERKLHPWVAFGILPLFAFANAGFSFSGMGMEHFLSPIPIGIALGLFLGKQMGIWSATMLAVRCGVSPLPKEMTPLGLYGLSLIAGVGFTMSLFIGTLAFHAGLHYAAFVRVGVIFGSLFSGFLGYWVLRRAYRE